MSVTFAIAGVPSLIQKVADGCDGLYNCVATQWDCGCEYVDGPGVDMANANAMDILGKLDLPNSFEDGLVGSVPVEDLLGRVLMAIATSDPDTGIAPTDDKVEGQARWIDCGRPAGYTDRRLGELRDLCEQARSMGADTIQWG